MAGSAAAGRPWSYAAPPDWPRRSPDTRASAEPAVLGHAACPGPIASADARAPIVRQAPDISARHASARARPVRVRPPLQGRQAGRGETSLRRSWSARTKDLVEGLLDSPLFGGGRDGVDDLLLAEHVHHTGRIGGNIHA